MTHIRRSAAELSESEAEAVGRQMGCIVTGAVVEATMTSYVGIPIGELHSTPHYQKFCDAFMKTLMVGLGGGVSGLQARSAMASDLRQAYNEACEKAVELAIVKEGKGSAAIIKELEELMEVSRVCGKAAAALFAPIQRNLDNLVTSGHQYTVMQQLREQVASAAQEQALAQAERECDNPECPIHGIKH